MYCMVSCKQAITDRGGEFPTFCLISGFSRWSKPKLPAYTTTLMLDGYHHSYDAVAPVRYEGDSVNPKGTYVK